MRPIARVLDRVVIGLAVAAALYMAFRTPAPGKFDLLLPGGLRSVGYLLGGALIAGGLVAATTRANRLVRWTGRLVFYGVTAVAVGMVHARVMMRVREAHTTEHWPPRLAIIRATSLDTLPPVQRAGWGSRIAVHLVAGSPALTGPLAMPDDWPFPADVEIAVRPGADGETEVWSRTGDGVAVCVTLPKSAVEPIDSLTEKECEDRHTAPPGLAFARPHRVPPAPRIVEHRVVGAPWPEYRGDAIKSGIAPSPSSASPGWRVAIAGEMRASASVVGNLVLAGAHGTGSLTALDLATGKPRWSARVPNWIHQDPVSDGRIVVVAFGDNKGSFVGRAPSGVSAFDLATGTRLWTAFDEGSVMTSPVIRDSTIIYGTGAALVRKRVVETGRLVAEGVLPGGVTMAPPASVGDTIVFAVDQDKVCALRISTLDLAWCRRLPHLYMMGHAAPTIAGDQVIVSGKGTVLTPTWDEFIHLRRRMQWRLIWSVLFPIDYPEYTGQVFAAVALHDGTLRWSSGLFGNPRLVQGHISGTAAVSGRTGVIILPMSDTTVGFDLATGRVRWTGSGHDSRGPPLVVDGLAVIAGRDGVIEVHDVTDGRLVCTMRRKVGYDRAGPVLAGGLVILADLNGGIEAIPKADVLDCSAPD